MKQLNFLPTRARRAAEPRLSPEVRRAYIRERLNGYAERQAIREKRRKRTEIEEPKQRGLFE